MPRFAADTLTKVARDLFVAAGTPPDVAGDVADLLVWSERIGHGSHGLLRIPDYVERIRRGRLVPDARPEATRQNTTTVIVDGKWGFGQVAALAAVTEGVSLARESGVAAVGAYRINHVGRLGDFTERAAREGMIGLAAVGGAPTGMQGNVAPYGGRAPVWGTNPLALAIPGPDGVFSLDFATSIIAGGKTAAARARGERLDGEHLIDSAGRPTDDPHAVLEGGAIRPFGEHKGYGLAFAVELLAGALVGAAAPGLERGQMHNGLFMLFVEPSGFGPVTGFHAAMAAVVERVRSSPPAEGFAEVLVPGDPEARRLAASERTGVELPAAVVEDLDRLAGEMGLDLSW